MIGCRRILMAGALVLSAGMTLHSEIISDALLSFPAQTEYVEYDNLASLRTLANYNTLRARFSGKPLEEAKAVLSQLGIEEEQVHEIVSGSSSTAFYGLMGGTFSGEAAAKSARAKNSAVKVGDTQAFCTGKGTCIVFLEDSLAGFGTLDSLKQMLQAREGVITRLSSNGKAVSLMNSAAKNAPVRGVLFGAQLKTGISDILQDWSGWKRDWSQLASNVSGIGYSVQFDIKAHVSATLECTSRTAAAVLLQMINTLSSLQSVTAPGSVPFQNLQVSASGDVVYFKADTAIPTSAPGTP